ncbi:hypothetical protein [Arthrobacter sp. UM1]|uniref:hypothetical protein n=1 Tax=Arthrobacter sp. UM1 TaxID=2766776 RepID=UPI001CF70ABE|nr:hypothetical protein [Arthrobacter sp. UM1]MCB4209164.1 hypothetical protein [Arthrobacter sp. UM1]
MTNEARSHKLGPGSLKLGKVGDAVEFAVGIESGAVEPKTEKGVDVLSGDRIAGDEEFTLKGALYQTYDRRSFLAWCHVHSGKKVPFIFTPNSEHELSVRGEVLVHKLTIGGKVKDRNTSDFEFEGVGMYDLYAGDTKITEDWLKTENRSTVGLAAPTTV